MPTLTITKSYQDGDILTEADLDSIRTDIITFVNTTKLDEDNIQDASILTAKLATDSVTTVKIVDANVTTAKIADDAITVDKLLDGEITKAKLASSLQELLVPTGTIHAYSSTTAPSGYLYCDGSAVSRTTYADLFAITGSAYGEGDGSTTFNLPDLRGQFLRGQDDTASTDPDAASRTAMNTGGNTGDAIGSVQSGEVGDHEHPMFNNDSSGSPDSFAALGNDYLNHSGNLGGFSGYQINGSGTTPTNGRTGGNDGSETRPTNAAVAFIIKV